MASIKVYSTPTCPWCRKLKDYLNGKGVEYEDIDVSTNDAAREEMVEASGHLGVPQMEINGKIIIGFDQESIEEELKNA